MPEYKCITGGLRLNGKKVPFGKIVTADRNPAEEHFILFERKEPDPKWIVPDITNKKTKRRK